MKRKRPGLSQCAPFILLVWLLSRCTLPEQGTTEELRPNIVYILADDLGYGDVGANNPDSKITTPHIDALASSGMRFTDAHSPSSVCTPTRYGILTGQYCWRSRLPRGVLRGYGRSIIPQDQLTVGKLLQKSGYRTGMIGKWHLGLDWAIKPEYQDSMANASVNDLGMVTEMNADWLDFSIPPSHGPLTQGFDYSFLLPASLDMDPYCYLKNDTLVAVPNEYTPGNDLNTGYTGAFWRAGRIAPGFEFDQVLPTFTQEAQDFIHRESQSSHPFFLYLALAAPHTPWVPTTDFQGRSLVGQYGDFVQMVDATVGEVINALEQAGVASRTLVIFTSDNGPFWRPKSIEQFDHRAAHIYRGMKADIWEGGHRIPFIVKWPGMVKPGSTCEGTTVLTNLLATCADIVGHSVTGGQFNDSHSIYSMLTGTEATEQGQVAIHHSSRAIFAIREDNWKLIEGRGSGGFSPPVRIQPGPGEPIGQLYDLKEDPSETTNLYLALPEKVKELQTTLDKIRNQPQ